MATKPKTTAQKQLAEANILLKKYKTRLATLEGDKTTLDTFATESKAAVTELKTVATEARTSAEESAKLLGGKIVNGKYVPPVVDTTAADAAKAAAAKAAKEKYDAEQAAKVKKAEAEAEKADAFALIQDTMRSYGFDESELKEINDFIQASIIDPNVGPNKAILNMRNLGAYKKRFSGNEALLKAGKNALSEYDYLQQENAYDEYFKAYGVGNLSTRAQKATLIGGSVSALELDKRLNLAVKRVQNSDPEILKQLKAYYPTITDKDLISYFLNPEAVRPELERKVTASEISAAAVGQGFTGGTSMSALGLADYGVDRSVALEGYANLAGVLPEATKLGDIYGETGIKYTQQTGEEEFLKSSDAAKRKRNILASKERASFEGSAGTMASSLKRSAAGQI